MNDKCIECRNIFSAKYKCTYLAVLETNIRSFIMKIEQIWKVRQTILESETSKVCELNGHQRASNYQMVVRQSLGIRQSLSTFHKEYTKKFYLS